MTLHLAKEIENLKRDMLTLSNLVEEALVRAVRALMERDVAAARDIIEGDTEIDLKEVEVEEECLKITALYQPVAIDLRLIITILKINNDLERIGDLIVNIAETASFLAAREPIEIPADLEEMSDRVKEMVHRCLLAVIYMNADEAKEILSMDERVDEIHRASYGRIGKRIARDPAHTDELIRMMSVFRYLERIADHATNIAEDVIYLVTGEIVRHAGSGR